MKNNSISIKNSNKKKIITVEGNSRVLEKVIKAVILQLNRLKKRNIGYAQFAIKKNNM